MPKLFETKSTNNKDNKKTDKIVKKSLLNTLSLKEDKKKNAEVVNTEEVKRRGRPPKNKEVEAKTATSKSTISNKSNLITTQPKVNKQIPSPQQRRWHNLLTNPPELERPIELNTDYKKPVYGYATYKGIIANNPYYINKHRKNTGLIEWQYINSCRDLSKCSNGFPDCENCDIFKKLNNTTKKK